jgi:probable HAF family extracellular repeat protein
MFNFISGAKVVFAVICLTVCSGHRSTLSAAPGDIYNLGTLSGSQVTEPTAINNSGQIVGWAEVPQVGSRAFLYTGTPGAGGTMINLGTLGGSWSEATDINDAGQIAGRTGNGRAFLYTGTPGAGGTMHDLGTLGGISSDARGINDAGQVVGGSSTAPFNLQYGFLYSGTPGAGGAMANLGSLPGGGQSFAFAINNSGQVTGEARVLKEPAVAPMHAFLYTGTPGAGGAMVQIVDAGRSSQGVAINDAGQVTGNIVLDDSGVQTVGFRYSGSPSTGGSMRELDTLGKSAGRAEDINDAGVVAGWVSNFSNGSDYIAALWLNDSVGTPVNLDAWLDATNPQLGSSWTLWGALGINDHGMVTGVGYYNDGPGGLSDGQRPFLLDASGIVPEPSGISLCIAGAAALLRRRR